MRKLILPLLLLWSVTLYAQKNEVLQSLKKYQVSEEVLRINLKDNLDKYPHQVERTVTVDDKDKVYVSNFDPNQREASPWTLVTVNGKAPSKLDQKAFDKEHSQQASLKADESTYKVVKDDGNSLEISYQYDPTSLSSDQSFLKDCVFTLHINAKTGRLEKMTEINIKDLRIKILKVTRMSTITHYSYLEQDNSYVPTDSVTELIIKVLGNEVPMITKEKYIIKN